MQRKSVFEAKQITAIFLLLQQIYNAVDKWSTIFIRRYRVLPKKQGTRQKQNKIYYLKIKIFPQ